MTTTYTRVRALNLSVGDVVLLDKNTAREIVGADRSYTWKGDVKRITVLLGGLNSAEEKTYRPDAEVWIQAR